MQLITRLGLLFVFGAAVLSHAKERRVVTNIEGGAYPRTRLIESNGRIFLTFANHIDVFSLEGEKLATFQVGDVPNSAPLRAKNIQAAMPDVRKMPDGLLVAGMFGLGLNFFSESGFVRQANFKDNWDQPGGGCMQLAVSPAGEVALYTSDGIFVWKEGKTDFFHDFGTDPNGSGRHFEKMPLLGYDPNGALWMAAQNSYPVALRNGEFTEFPEKRYVGVQFRGQDRAGRIYFSGEENFFVIDSGKINEIGPKWMGFGRNDFDVDVSFFANNDPLIAGRDHTALRFNSAGKVVESYDAGTSQGDEIQTVFVDSKDHVWLIASNKLLLFR